MLKRKISSLFQQIRFRLALPERRRLAQLEQFWSNKQADKSNKNRDLSLFNFDLHISMTADLAMGFQGKANYISWNASYANKIMRPDFPNPDPVSVVNQWTWMKLDASRVRRFQRRYRSLLPRFDGFVVSYPIAFSLLFESSGAPILAVIGTRYDWPMSRDSSLWEAFDTSIREMHKSGQLHIAANNQADADYFKCMVGIEIAVVPSYCDYVFEDSSAESLLNPIKFPPIFLGGDRLSRSLTIDLESIGVQPSRTIFPNGYRWGDLAQTEYVFLVPYNVSTMTLFELATLGTRVVIPDDDWLVEMFLDNVNGSLSELMFEGAQWRVPGYGKIPSPDSREEFARWWLERSDFGNEELMPNVVRVSKVDLKDGIAVPEIDPVIMSSRNERTKASRHKLLEGFIEKVRQP